MNRSWFLAHWRRILMQAVLCGLLAITLGLAALATYQKRLALRLVLSDKPVNVGRLSVNLPVGWSPVAISEETSGGDSFFVDEPLGDGKPGRRLTFHRFRTAGLPAPLEQLLRSMMISGADLTGGENPHTFPSKVQRLEVAGWPGVMVTRAISKAGGRRVQKEVLACAILPPAQAVVIQLDGTGEPDAADEELVRQMAETVAVVDLIRSESGGTVELGAGMFVPVPDHFCWSKSISDPNRTSRDLLSDGHGGQWATIELIPCLWLPGDDEQAFLSLLAIHDRDWRSGSVKKLGEWGWQVDRVDGNGATGFFPSRAYCLTNGEDQAVMAVMHGGLHEDQLFDSAWAAITANVRFPASHELPKLLQNGEVQVRQLVEQGANQFLPTSSGSQFWSLWDQSENADKQFWMKLEWAPFSTVDKPSGKKEPDDVSDIVTDESIVPPLFWQGSRTIGPDRNFPLMRSPGSFLRMSASESASESTQQKWNGAANFSDYNLSVDRIVSIRGERTATQRWEARDHKLHNVLTGDKPKPAPPQYIPGGWLPLILGKLTDDPMVLRTESFIGCDGIAPSELLTLTVRQVHGNPMRCVTVTVNGTGQQSRWWYDLDGGLRYIDFAGGFRAQCDGPQTFR